MERLKPVLSAIETPSILDVATGSGAFLETLATYATNPVRCIGIDQKFREGLNKPQFQFELMDGHEIQFEDATFDIVGISNSLHHMNNPQKVLSEMARVLKPDGLLVVFEMVKDNQNERQMTHVLMHHYWAEIDEKSGISHKETFSREELAQLIEGEKSLNILEKWELLDDGTYEDEDSQKMLTEAVTHYLETTKNWPEAQIYEQKAAALLERLQKVGFESATECLYVYQKK